MIGAFMVGGGGGNRVPVARYRVTSSSNSPTAGTPVTITAQLLHADGTDDATAGVTVNWTKTGTGGSLSAASSVTNGSGVATITLTPTTVAGVVHRVRGTDSSTRTGSTGGITVIAGAATKYVVTPASLTPVAGATDVITAQLADSHDNAVSTAGLTVTWSKTGAGATFSSPTSLTNASGIATITLTVATDAATNHTVTATDGGALTGTSSTINVAPGALHHYSITPASLAPSAASVDTITAQAEDQYNNAVLSAGHVVTWSATGVGGSFSAPTSTTNGSGVATVDFTVGAASVHHIVTGTDETGKTGSSADIVVSNDPFGVLAIMATVGGSGHVTLIRRALVGQTVVGGKLQTWDDARGALGYGPSATGFGAPKPAVDAVTGAVTCDGVQNVYSTGSQAIFDEQTPGTWIFVGIVPNSSVAVVLDTEPSTGYPNLDAMVGTGGKIESYFHDGTSRGLTADGLQIITKTWAGTSPSGGAQPGDSWKMLEVRGHVPSAPTNDSPGPGLVGPKSYRVGDWTNGPGFNAATVEYFSMFVDHALSSTERVNLVAALKTQFPAIFIDNSKGYIIPDGDSRVAGAGLGDPATESWPAKMMVTLGLSATYEMMNNGVNSRQTRTALAEFDKRIGGFYDSGRTLKQIVFVAGSFINSHVAGATDASILADFIAHCNQARALGNIVIAVTELPWIGAGGYPSASVDAYNAYIRLHRADFADELADFALILTNPADGINWQGDQIHPNATGHAALANDATYGAAAAVSRLP